MRLVLISDTHTMHDQVKLPDGDVLIHCGDFTYAGRLHEIESFLEWFKAQPHKHKILICGNHELNIEDGVFGGSLHNQDMIYLENESCTIDGVNFHGFPYTPTFFNWAFMRGRDEMKKELNEVPLDTDVLISHGAPRGVLDYVTPSNSNQGGSVGCIDLYSRIIEVQPKISCFGHIHEGYGSLSLSGTTFINCAICDGNYQPINKPFVYDL